MEYKEDVVEAKERMNAWWDHEIIDRPVLSYYYPIKRGKTYAYIDLFGEDWSLAINHDEIEEPLNGFEKRAENTYFGGESIPYFFPNYGPGIMAAVLGVTPKFQTRTVWFSRPIKPENIVEHLESVKINQNNEWYSRLLKITETAAKRAGKNYVISMTDIGGVLDILSSFLGPTNTILTMKRNPEVIDTCRSIILEKLLKVYIAIQNLVDKHCDGCSSHMGVWGKKRWHAIQCDFSAMLNPKWFKKFVLPDIISQAEHTDYAIYHLDGPNALPYLDSLLDEPSITGIQWVPGVGNPRMGSKEWIPLYKKIQNSGKNLVIDSAPYNVSHLYKTLDPRELYVRTFYNSEYVANQYLPNFLGGREGEIIIEATNWLKEQGKNNITKELFEKFLIDRNLELENRYRRDLFKEIGNTFIKNWHY